MALKLTACYVPALQAALAQHASDKRIVDMIEKAVG